MTTVPSTAEDDAFVNTPLRWTLPRQVLTAALVLPAITIVALMGPGPFAFPPVGILVAVQVVCAGLLAWRGYKWAALVGGIALFVLAALNVPFLGPEALRPDHGMTFIVAQTVILLGLVGIVAGIAAFVQARRNAFDRARWGTPGAVGVLLVAGALLSTLFAGLAMNAAPVSGAGSVALTPDATREVTVSEFAFPAVTIPADQIVKLSITNADAELHTFTVPALSIDAELPGGKTVDVWVKAAAGTYLLYCTPHSGGEQDDGTGMVGELVVE